MSREYLREQYLQLYGNTEAVILEFDRLLSIMETAKVKRRPELRQLDKNGNDWYLSEQTVGMMLYLDKFCRGFQEFEEKIEYLSELGISYVHFMPLLKAREGNSDGGYAVADYLNVDNRFGTTKEFIRVVQKMKDRGIRTCIDLVLNHTAKEHKWAEKSVWKPQKGWEDMYYTFPDDREPKEYEKTMTQIFPEVAPGNFTYYEELNQYVMTRFYEFQWDLNYKNPKVFNAMAEVLLTLANYGVDMFRLDAIPYMWKEKGTSSMNLPQVHRLIRMFKAITREVCPSVVFLGEAIVEPHEIVKYFGEHEEKECDVMYNASLMVLLWSSLASRDVHLMTRSLLIDYKTPEDGVWINYIRCHDDIGWGFEEEIQKKLGIDPMKYKQFMIGYMEGTYPGSFSKGELYEFNPMTLDARNSGTLASMCGLERAMEEKDHYHIELAVKRILLLNAMVISYTGIPLLYSGDEIGTLNNWSYKQEPEEAGDSRWLHRGPMDWEKAEKRGDRGSVEGYLFSKIRELIALRKENPLFHSGLKSIPIDTGNSAIFGFHKEDKMLVLGNFTDQVQTVDCAHLNWFGLPGELTDLIQGKKVWLAGQVTLGPYEYLWLV